MSSVWRDVSHYIALSIHSWKRLIQFLDTNNRLPNTACRITLDMWCHNTAIEMALSGTHADITICIPRTMSILVQYILCLPTGQMVHLRKFNHKDYTHDKLLRHTAVIKNKEYCENYHTTLSSFIQHVIQKIKNIWQQTRTMVVFL